MAITVGSSIIGTHSIQIITRYNGIYYRRKTYGKVGETISYSWGSDCEIWLIHNNITYYWQHIDVNENIFW